jgi:hypothetical protein
MRSWAWIIVAALCLATLNSGCGSNPDPANQNTNNAASGQQNIPKVQAGGNPKKLKPSLPPPLPPPPVAK